jgi:LysR family hydrogen peroxide-inducible transcriptional activator
MNFQQLEYVVAVDQHRHFARAAETCFVTQATLSMMIKKLEGELGLVIFDRSRQPVVPTDGGLQVIAQARIVLKEAELIRQMARSLQSGLQGDLRLGIIPTLAPYLLPLFLSRFLEAYPAVRLKIQEQTTDQLLQLLATDRIDVALMVTPSENRAYQAIPLFQEEFKVFVAGGSREYRKKYILPEEIDVSRLWLLEEGHCLRSQTLNLCELQEQQARAHNLAYEAGSIESLIRITEINQGITIIPQLATLDFDGRRQEQLRHFRPPVPVREISLITYRHFVKAPLLGLLEKSIREGVQAALGAKAGEGRVIPV